MDKKKEQILQRVVGELQKRFGKESVNFLGNSQIESIPRISSQCLAIDDVTGGGYPLGRIIEIYGGESSGKTTACYHAIAEAQKQFPDKFCALVDSEFSFDPQYASQCGVNVQELVVAQPSSGNDGFAILQGMIESGASLVVVDSVAAMVPREEVEEEDFNKSTIGLQARMMSKALRKLTSVIGRYKAIVIFTNQTREKIGVMYGNPECVTPDTRVEVAFGKNSVPYIITMEELFEEAGLDFVVMKENTAYDISDKDIYIRSYNHKKRTAEMRRILSLVRKSDAKVHELMTANHEVLLRCSGAHRIFDMNKNDYVSVVSLESGRMFDTSDKGTNFSVFEKDEVSPILDLEVEGNQNYFTNGFLSHNTTTGGMSLKYYASIRLKVSKIGTVETGSGDNKTKTSIRTRVEAVKNKTAPPFKRGEFIITFGKGIDNEASFFDAIIEKGLVQSKGAGWFNIDGKPVAQGATKLKEYFHTHPDVYERLKSQLQTSQPSSEQISEKPESSDESVVEEVGEI